MPDTPFFPAWRAHLHRRRPLKAAFEQLRRCTLDKLEERLGLFLAGLPELSAAGISERERPYSVRRTFWCFLWQMLQPNGTCRDVVRQLHTTSSEVLATRAGPKAAG